MSRENRALAEAVLSLAVYTQMPYASWQTDDRIALACRVLHIHPSQAPRRAEEIFIKRDERGLEY